MSDNSARKTISGLSSAEVKKRTADGRANGDQDIKTKSVWQILKTNTFTFFNLLFVGLAILLAFFVEPGMEGLSNFGFLMVVIINLLIGITQELSAKRTIDKLSLLSAPRAKVIRDGEEKDIAIKDIVMDDIVLLSSGNQISADSKIIKGSVEVNESLLTGESDPVIKNEGDEILSGSYILSGSAVSQVIRVGKENYATKISAGAKYIKAPNSVILKSVTRFIKIMAIIILPLGATLFAIKYFGHGGNLNEVVLTVAANLISMIPSGLMLLTTGVFCLSVIRLGKHKALARDLYCVETLARVDMLCLDKTGTITEGSMEVAELIPHGISEEEMRIILSNILASVKDNNPTANAIREYIENDYPAETTEDIIPFSSQRKWSGAVFENVSYAMGAAEFMIKRMTADMKKALKSFSERGNRVLILVSSDKPIRDKTLPAGLKFLGYILISDKIRKEAPSTLRFFAEQGVNIKIISGDNPLTVRSIARKAGVKDADNYVDATTIPDEELPEAAAKYTVFGRVTPDQKLKLVKALKSRGHTVAMTGDGVNDVLALKEADCSVAMAAGSDAAKNVAQLVLQDNNFASMPKIVAEGRRSINNLERSASLYLVKTLYSFMFAVIFLFVNRPLPFEPRHLTLVGMVTIGIPSMVLALEANKERVTGRFFSKVVTNAFPSAVTVVISVMAIVFIAPLMEMTKEQISTAALVVTAAVGYAYLAKISFPFNLLRTVLFVSMVGILVAAFLADFSFFSLPEFFGLSTEITPGMLKLMIPVAALAVPLFFGVYLIAKRLGKWRLVDKSLDKMKI